MLVLLTALSYLTVYWFKLGTYAGLGISEKFVRIEFSDTLYAGVVLSMYLALPLMLLFLARLVHEEVSHLRWVLRMGIVVVAVLAAAGYFKMYSGGRHNMMIYGIVALCLALPCMALVSGIIAFPLILILKSPKKPAREVAAKILVNMASPDLYQEFLGGILRQKYLVVLIVALLSGIVVHRVGVAIAQHETTFTHIQNTPYVVIDTLNDRLLCKSVNEKQDGLLPGFTLVPMREGEAMSFVSLKLNKKNEKTAAPAVVTEPSKPEPAAPTVPAVSKATPADPAAAAPASSTTAPAP